MSAKAIEKPRCGEAEEKPFSLLSDEKLMEIYAAMLQCRLLAGRAGVRAQRGREAMLAGVLVDLRGGDGLALAEPDLLARFLFGASLKWVAGKLSARDFRQAMRCEQAAAVEAVDEALECKRRKAEELVVSLLPTAWAEQSEWRWAMEAAWKRKLPMIFVSYGAGSGFSPEFPAIPVDGQDAVAIYRVMTEASVRARQGGWPTLIDCVPFVIEGQKNVKKADAVLRMERYLRGKRLFRPECRRKITADFTRAMDGSTVPMSSK